MTRHKKPNSGRPLMALLNTLLAFATGLVVWVVVFLVFSGTLSTPPPFMPVIIFALVMGAASFVLDIDIVLRWFAAIWRLIGRIFSRLI